MKGSWTTDRLMDAVGQLCNGTIGDADGRELDELLAEDPQARRLYTNYMWMHACLYAEGGALAAQAGEAVEADRLHFERAALAALANPSPSPSAPRPLFDLR